VVDTQVCFDKGISFTSAKEWDEAINCCTETIRPKPKRKAGYGRLILGSDSLHHLYKIPDL